VKALELKGVAKAFGAVEALRGVDLVVGAREFLVVLGPTGAGKTTLLRTIAGLESPDRGEVVLFGAAAAHTPPAQRDVALVFQNFSLYPSKSVRENLAFPLLAPGRNLSKAEIAERVSWAAGLLHIERLLDRPARKLSGGEMQRVAIGRAIVRRPKLFLMDEPLTNLDAKLREELRVELRELARRLETPVVWVTHDSAEALSMADRIAALVEGRILQVGAPEELYFRPVSPVVARQLGSPPMNIVDARASNGHWRLASGAALTSAPPGSPAEAQLGFRPEHVALEGGESEAVVEVVEDLGPQRVVVLNWGGISVHAALSRRPELRLHQKVRPRIAPEFLVVWPRGS
jgi:multiple sugar transport system ATP-binding protein